MSALHLIADVPPPEKIAAAQTNNPDSRSTTFQSVEGGPETHSGANLLVAAYAVLWVILMAWLFSLWRKQANLHAKIDDLEKTLDRAAAKLEKK
jgi:CcmD family protein